MPATFLPATCALLHLRAPSHMSFFLLLGHTVGGDQPAEPLTLAATMLGAKKALGNLRGVPCGEGFREGNDCSVERDQALGFFTGGGE